MRKRDECGVTSSDLRIEVGVGAGGGGAQADELVCCRCIGVAVCGPEIVCKGSVVFAEEAREDGAILFVDECESIFSRRTQDTKDYKSAVTTELLQRINGFGVDGSKRIMIAATNRPDIIDPAYLRYKRFSHLIHVTPPDDEAKRAIIESKLDGIELDGITTEDVLEMSNTVSYKKTEIGYVSTKTGYYSAADLCGIIEEACRLALEILQANESTTPIPLTREMFEKAFQKIAPSISQELLDEYDNFRRG